ncbi:MAG: hypothetical protein VR70_14510 [Rhodospirillaceae bacterium BRH_c57]|nr:MAG: hypothetical protein VR70_14510 [Rhodospirillaceae bacterium BRH_c57]
MWATMEPDVYGGDTHDQIVPRWRIYADGDKDADHETGPLELLPSRFPPGTKVTVEEPVCPDCGALREPHWQDNEQTYGGPCDCGFDWDGWVLDQFS